MVDCAPPAIALYTTTGPTVNSLLQITLRALELCLNACFLLLLAVVSYSNTLYFPYHEIQKMSNEFPDQ